jgi:hypothetical protein
MGIAYNPRIVTDGLVLCLDAGNTKSYPGSGTAWTDLSGRGNTGTLTNGPTYSSVNGGSLVFNGSSQYATLGTTSSLRGIQVPLTICGWANSNSFSGIYPTLYSAYASTVGGQLYSMIRVDSGTLIYYASNSSGGFQSQGTFTPSPNVWNFYAIVVSGSIASPTVKIFLNGTSQSFSYTSFTSSPDLSVDFRIGSNQAQPATESWNGNISAVQAYTRALSDSEVSQNFNALRGRYGI